MSELYINIDLENTLTRLSNIADNIEHAFEALEIPADEMMESMVVLSQQIWDAQGPHLYEIGNLRDSIHYEGSFPTYTFTADAVNAQNQYYAVFLEFGTSKMRAQPFMWPAVQQTVADYNSIIRQHYLAVLRGE